MNAEPETRRQRLRRELQAEVVDSARTQLAEGGPGGVTWRGIARSVGINPASLYTYFDSLDDVFTAVILDSFERLGQAIQETDAKAEDATAADRLITLALAYRQWAVDHPAEFNLIFTDQLPGYAAPPDGPTVAAQTAIFGPFATALAELMGADASGSAANFSGFNREDALVLPDNPAVPVGMWATMHGLVMLEINNHLPDIEDHQSVFVEAMERTLSGWTS